MKYLPGGYEIILQDPLLTMMVPIMLPLGPKQTNTTKSSHEETRRRSGSKIALPDAWGTSERILTFRTRILRIQFKIIE